MAKEKKKGDQEENTKTPAEAYQNLLKKHNDDAGALATKLFDENFQYRQTIRELKDEVPEEGAVILTGDDAKSYTEFKEFIEAQKDLGISDIKDLNLKEVIEERDDLKTENKKMKRDKVYSSVCDIGYDGQQLNKKVLKKLMADQKGVKFEVEETKGKDKKPVKVVMVKTKDNDKAQTLKEFAEAEFGDFLPSLIKDGTTQPTKTTRAFTPDPKKADQGVDDAKAEDQARSAQGSQLRSAF